MLSDKPNILLNIKKGLVLIASQLAGSKFNEWFQKKKYNKTLNYFIVIQNENEFTLAIGK